MSGALSDNLTEHQLTQDPGGLGTEVLASNLADELEQLRFCIKRITGKAQWYIAPAIDLESIGGTIPTLIVTKSASFQGDLSPAQITSNQNNYAPTGHADAFRFRLSSDASRDLTGIAGGALGRIIVLQNIGSFPIILRNDNGASTAGNRFLIVSDTTIYPGWSMGLQYDNTTQRWRPLSVTLPNNVVIGGTFTMNGDLSGLVNLLQSGYTEIGEISPPGNPAADKVRFYAKDVSGTSKLAYKRSDGIEVVLDVPPTGGIESIANGSLSGTQVTITNIPETYTHLILSIEGLSIDTSSRGFQVHPSVDNGSNYDSTAGNFKGTDFVDGTPSAHTIASLMGNATYTANAVVNAVMNLFGYHTGPKLKLASSHAEETFFASRISSDVAYLGNGSNIDALRIIVSGGSGNFDAGTYNLYGVK
jgi:hypothetical protein